jgi:nicotinate-nucleotide adenylyltransferase
VEVEPDAFETLFGAAGPRPRVGLFGGSFDPVHRGHVHAARAARDEFRLDGVVFVPAARPPHKPGRALASGADRMAMLALALDGERGFAASDLELTRAGPSYTFDTVVEVARRVPAQAALHLVLGADNLSGLSAWYRAEELLARVQPIVVHREGDLDVLLAELAGKLSARSLARLAAGLVRLPPVSCSSSDVRAALAAGRVPEEDLPRGVGDYIRARGLYGIDA